MGFHASYSEKMTVLIQCEEKGQFYRFKAFVRQKKFLTIFLLPFLPLVFLITIQSLIICSGEANQRVIRTTLKGILVLSLWEALYFQDLTLWDKIWKFVKCSVQNRRLLFIDRKNQEHRLIN